MLLADDPMATIDLPRFCAEAGHALVATEAQGDHTRFTVRKA